MNNDKYIMIGKVVNTFGIKGELKITSESDFIDYRFRVGATIYLLYGKEYIKAKVSSMRMIKGCVSITINDIHDINEVIKYIGVNVYCLKDDKPILEDGTYMIDDLVGLDVYHVDGNHLGIVKDVLIMPTQDILDITLDNNQSLLIPFVDEYVKEVCQDKIVIITYEVLND